MKDCHFLTWLYIRLLKVHGEPENIDYMGKLRSIIEAYDPNAETPNTAPKLSSEDTQ